MPNLGGGFEPSSHGHRHGNRCWKSKSIFSRRTACGQNWLRRCGHVNWKFGYRFTRQSSSTDIAFHRLRKFGILLGAISCVLLRCHISQVYYEDWIRPSAASRCMKILKYGTAKRLNPYDRRIGTIDSDHNNNNNREHTIILLYGFAAWNKSHVYISIPFVEHLHLNADAFSHTSRAITV